jgi:hypothetical protein
VTLPLPPVDPAAAREAAREAALSADARVRRPRLLRPGWVVLGALALATAGAAGVRVWRGRGAASGAEATAVVAGTTTPPPATDSLARAPAGVRVKVEVVNTTRTRGLARRATRALRDRGYDVVAVGNAAGAAQDSTVVLDRSGHPDWARRLARAMGGARVETRPDSSRYLDLTVLVGRNWRPPPDPLDP